MTAISDMRRELARLDRRRLAAVRAAAARVRRELVVPLCHSSLNSHGHASLRHGDDGCVRRLRTGRRSSRCDSKAS